MYISHMHGAMERCLTYNTCMHTKLELSRAHNMHTASEVAAAYAFLDDLYQLIPGA